MCPGGEIHQLRRFLGFDTECKKLTPTGGGIIMRALEPEVAKRGLDSGRGFDTVP